MEIVIFSGYNDFSYAREALRYGVVDYVLKPVDPEEFSKTLSRVIENIRTREEEKEQRERQIDYLIKYFFIEYLYASNTENVDKLEELTAGGCILSRCVRMILVSASNGFFETDEEHFTGALKDQIHREFYYVNLNSNESLLLFTEKYADYRALADTLHQFFLQQFETDCYFAVSEPLESWKDMPEEFRRLEKLLEEQFYQPGQHVFVMGEPERAYRTRQEKTPRSWNRSAMTSNIKTLHISGRILAGWSRNIGRERNFRRCMSNLFFPVF